MSNKKLHKVSLHANIFSKRFRDVKFYKTSEEKKLVARFLNTLPSRDRQKVTWVLQILEEVEHIPVEYWKKLKPSDIWECRVSFGRSSYRVFGFFDKNNIVLTHGILKKTRKTPLREIKKALKYKQEHELRGNGYE